MKIRCTQNSIRLRLRKSDVALLEEDGKVVEYLAFPAGNRLEFVLEIEARSEIALTFEGPILSVHLPKGTAESWINSDQVGIEKQIGALHLLIEKDFPCIHRPHENKADTFQELSK